MAIERLRINSKEGIIIEIEKKSNALKEMFGFMKSKKPTEQILKEARKDLKLNG